MNMRRTALSAALLLLPAAACAQSQPVFQSGTMIPGHLAKFQTNGLIGDVGGTLGDPVFGRGVGPFAILDGSGSPNLPGIGLCLDSAVTGDAHNALCAGHDASSNALITVDSYGGLADKDLIFRINGASYTFPGSGAGTVLGPDTTTINEPVVWNNTAGTLVKDGLGVAIVHTGDFAVVGTTALTGPLDVAPTAGLSSLNALYFPTYSQLAGGRIKLALSGAVSDANNFRDALYLEVTDSDTGTYTASLTNFGARVASFGPYSAGWQTSTKNHGGLTAYAAAATTSTPSANGAIPGVAGILAEAFQYGAGTAANEFSVQQPDAAGGSIAQSVSLAAVQAIITANYADADATHTVYAVAATHVGTKIATAAFSATGAGEYLSFVDAQGTTVTTQGIVMPGSVSGFTGTIINYGLANGNPAGGSFTYWDGTAAGGTYGWVNSGILSATVSTAGMTVAPADGFNGYNTTPVSGTGGSGLATFGTWASGINTGSATITDAALIMGGSTQGTTIRSTSNFVQIGKTGPNHLAFGQTTPPALTSCGTAPAISGTDVAGTVTMGTDTPAGCVITFNVAYATVPECTVTWQATPLASQSYAVSATAITLTQTATDSNKANYSCVARAGG